jgi:hypothetical protein
LHCARGIDDEDGIGVPLEQRQTEGGVLFRTTAHERILHWHAFPQWRP